MVTITIDEIRTEAEEGETILQAAKKAGISIPTLCYLEGLNEIGACRLCLVEVEGMSRLVASCNTKAEEGMKIHTRSPKVLQARRVNMELLLSQHNCECPKCVRNGNCVLQKTARDLGILEIRYPKKIRKKAWLEDYPLIRDEEKCVKCMRCIQVCSKIQGTKVWDLVGTGGRTTVGVRDHLPIDKAGCVLCGQCITHCPVGALKSRDDTDRVLDALRDPERITVLQVAPAVRAAWGEEFGLSSGQATEKRMVAALKRLGFDYVFDTNFSADLTIMEEGSELCERLKNSDGKETMPMFTSCCPGWVRYVKSHYPQYVKDLSSAKSPQQMFGAVAKTYYAELLGVKAEQIYSVSVMPCVAKKYECGVKEVNDAGSGSDVDASLTTREMAKLIRRAGLEISTLPEEDFDAPLGTASGAGVIFGVTGGVMEAALRRASYLLTGTDPDPDAFHEVRGGADWREAEFQIGERTLRTAVASGLCNAKALIERIERGEAHYDFVEVMACPGGCAGGGGQPISEGAERFKTRGEALYTLDRKNPIRLSYENPSIKALYADYLGKPLGEKAHRLLHTDQEQWSL